MMTRDLGKRGQKLVALHSREMLNSWFNNGGHSPKGTLMLKFWINVQIYTNFYTDIQPNFLFSISSVLLAADN
jgi:hypothetical protein